MRRFLPRFHLRGSTLCERDGDAEGFSIDLEWGRIVIQLHLLRRERH